MRRIRPGRAGAVALAWATLGVGVLIFSPATFAGAKSVGVYPTQFAFANSLRGGAYEQTLGIIDNSPTPDTYELSATGTIAPWLSFREASDPSTVVTSVQAHQGPPTQVIVRIDVPRKAGNGIYHGVVDVTPSVQGQVGGNQSGQRVAISAQIPVGVSVTGTEVLAGRVLDAYTYPAIEVGSALRLFTKLVNTGNVEVHPAIDVTIDRGATVMLQHTFTGGPLDPGVGSRTLESEWKSTSAWPVGSYAAHVAVSYLGQPIGSKNLSFKVVPYGSLRRAGKLEGLRLENRPEPGGAAVVGAVVRNTGQIATRPVFHGGLYRDGTLVRGITSVPLLVLPGQTSTIDMVIDVPQGGAYTLKGQADFDGTQSNLRSLSFQVGASSVPIVVWLLGAAALLASGILVWLIRRVRKSPPESGGPKHAAGGHRPAAPRPLVDSAHR